MSLLYKLKNILKPSASLSLVENKINYLFHNRDYLVQAFTHKSISPLPRKNYERLEFLGDAVIDIIISRELMREFPEGDEGLLTQRRASLVRKSFLAQISKMLDLLDHINIESSVNMNIEKIAEKQQANLYEYIIGAVYFSQFPGKYFTGDGCRRDEDGYYWITGRVDDIIIVSGHNMGT